jgi:hypothetical protein
MSVRAYMLLDIAERSCEYASQILRSRAEVVLADRLDGYPNLITVVEAADRQSLAEAIIPVLDCVNGIAEDMRLLISQDGETSLSPLASSSSISRRRRARLTSE